MIKKVFLVIGGILIVALLAGGAFMTMRLLNAKAQNFAGGKGNMSFSSAGGPGGAKSVMIKLKPAPELPTQAADLRGLITDIQDNSLYVAQMNNIQVSVSNGKTQMLQPTPAGPYTEVVVSKDTKIWRDVTMEDNKQPSGGTADQPVEIQQKVEASDISAIAAGSFAQIWGQRRGDRLIADTIVVQGIAVIKGGGGK
jgi:hypothetical protein